MGYAEVLLPRVLGSRPSNGLDANTAIRIGTDTDRPLLDLLPDEFLDFRQVGLGFEFTPVSIISRACHRSVLSMTETGSSTQVYVPVGRMDLRVALKSDGVVFRKHDRQNDSRNFSENHLMRGFRFHIGTLVIVVLALGVGFAALRESNDIWDSGMFSLTLGILLTSVLLALHRAEKRRAFWLGFALFGTAYLGLSLVPSIESRLITTKALAYIDSKVPRMIPAGLAYADFDRDGKLDLYVVNNSQPNALHPNKATVVFEEATANGGSKSAGIQVTGSGNLYLSNSARLWLRGSVGTTESFMRIGHSLIALALAFVGGQLSRWLHSRSLGSTSDPGDPTPGHQPTEPLA